MSFHLKSSDNEFNSRVRSVFDSLEAVEHNLSTFPDSVKSDDNVESNTKKRSYDEIDNSPRSDCGQFLKPKVPIPKPKCDFRGRQKAECHKNSQKWMLYNLEDTKCSSDSENKQIGMELMTDLKKSSVSNDDEISPMCTEEEEEEFPKIVFKKPISTKHPSEHPSLEGSDEEHSITSESVIGQHVLPEFTFKNIKNKIKKKQPSTIVEKSSKAKEITLSHLIESEEDSNSE